MTGFVEEGGEGEIGEGHLGGDALFLGGAAMPASWSPLRAGVALASNVGRSSKV